MCPGEVRAGLLPGIADEALTLSPRGDYRTKEKEKKNEEKI
jgi:hypothetical protein